MKRLLTGLLILTAALGVALAVLAAEEEPGFPVDGDDGAAKAAADTTDPGDAGPPPDGVVGAVVDGATPPVARLWGPPEGDLPWGLQWPDEATIATLLAAPDQPAAPDKPAAPDPPAAAGAAVGIATDSDVVALPGIAPASIRPLEGGAEDGIETGIGERIANLTRLDAKLEARLEELERVEKRIQAMYAESVQARRFAEEACGGPVVTAKTVVGVVEPTAEERDARLAMVTDIVKKMKPDTAAKVMAEWDEALAIRVLARLGARRSSPVLSKMPVEVAGKLTRRMIAGEGAVRVGRPSGLGAP